MKLPILLLPILTRQLCLSKQLIYLTLQNGCLISGGRDLGLQPHLISALLLLCIIFLLRVNLIIVQLIGTVFPMLDLILLLLF